MKMRIKIDKDKIIKAKGFSGENVVLFNFTVKFDYKRVNLQGLIIDKEFKGVYSKNFKVDYNIKELIKVWGSLENCKENAKINVGDGVWDFVESIWKRNKLDLFEYNLKKQIINI